MPFPHIEKAIIALTDGMAYASLISVSIVIIFSHNQLYFFVILTPFTIKTTL